jgi:hypothetical protein
VHFELATQPFMFFQLVDQCSMASVQLNTLLRFYVLNAALTN